jgi:phosphate transport system protein
MTHLENELKQLKAELLTMWGLVAIQMNKSLEALVNNDKELASEVVITEKRINSFELKLDRDCENIIALYNPVAVDLRFVLAVMKINTNLERIGDIARSTAKFVARSQFPYDQSLLEKTRLLEIYEEACDLVHDCKEAFENENPDIARKIFMRDELLDEINRGAPLIIAEIIRGNPQSIEPCLDILSTIRRLERAGDHCKNIAEEIIFYIEAKVVKHNKKKQQPDS